MLYFAFNDIIMEHISSTHVVRNVSQILHAIPFVNRPDCDTLRLLFDDWFVKYFTRTRLYFLMKSWKPMMRGKAKYLNMTMDTETDYGLNEEYVEGFDDIDATNDRIELNFNNLNEFNLPDDDSEAD